MLIFSWLHRKKLFYSPPSCCSQSTQKLQTQSVRVSWGNWRLEALLILTPGKQVCMLLNSCHTWHGPACYFCFTCCLLLKISFQSSSSDKDPLLGIYPKKTKTLSRKDICTPVFTASLFTIAKIWKQPKCPLIDERIKIYMQWNISPKEEWNLAIFDNMDEPKGYYA